MKNQKLKLSQSIFKAGINKTSFNYQPGVFRYCCNCSSDFDSTYLPALLSCGHVCCTSCISIDSVCDLCQTTIRVQKSPFNQLLAYFQMSQNYGSSLQQDNQENKEELNFDIVDSIFMTKKTTQFKDKVVQFLQDIDTSVKDIQHHVDRESYQLIREKIQKILEKKIQSQQKLKNMLDSINRKYDRGKNNEEISIINILIVEIQKIKESGSDIKNEQFQRQSLKNIKNMQNELKNSQTKIWDLELHILNVNQMMKNLNISIIASFPTTKFISFQKCVAQINNQFQNYKERQYKKISDENYEEKSYIEGQISSYNQKYHNKGIQQLKYNLHKVEQILADIIPQLS